LIIAGLEKKLNEYPVEIFVVKKFASNLMKSFKKQGESHHLMMAFSIVVKINYWTLNVLIEPASGLKSE
jgi:hypothetical protein